MSDNTLTESMSMMLGEMRGQMRELIHTINNTAVKVNHVYDKVALLNGVPAELAALKLRIDLLEAERHRRAGAVGIFQAVTNSKALGIIASLVIAAVAYFKGRGTL